MKGLNARIKGVHKANEGLCGEVGNQNFFFWKLIDWLDMEFGVKQENGATWGSLYNNGY